VSDKYYWAIWTDILLFSQPDPSSHPAHEQEDT